MSSGAPPLSPTELRRRRLAALEGGAGRATIVRPWDKNSQYKPKDKSSSSTNGTMSSNNESNCNGGRSNLKRPPPAAAAAAAAKDNNGNKNHGANKKPKSSSSNNAVYDLTGADDDEVEVTAVAQARACASAPIKLFATLSDQQERRRHPSEPNHWSRTQCMTLREMLGFDDKNKSATATIEWMVISNYLVDFAYLLDEIPELLSLRKVVVFYGNADTSFEPWKRSSGGSNCLDVIQLDPSARADDPANPLAIRIPYGVHHTKMFLVGFSDRTIRVVIHTANLRSTDIHVKAQAAYIQDFPMKQQQQQEQSSSSEFEDTLVSYLKTYGYNKKHRWLTTTTGGGKEEKLIDTIRRYDYSSALAILIPSTPGYHDISGTEKLGHLKLRDAVARHSAPDPTNNRPIVCQFSSIGALSEKYLNELQISMDTNLARRASNDNNSINPYKKQKTTTTPSSLRLQLVYPTVEEVRTSVEGYVGGGSVPGNHKNVSKEKKPFLENLFRKWSSSSSSSTTTNPLWKGQNVPHIKTYYQYSRDEGQQQQQASSYSLDWFVVTSHNMSKAAWGEIQNSSKYGGHRLFIRHWELGLFISPQTLRSKRLVPWTPTLSLNAAREGDCTVPVPYKVEPDSYGPRDEPWAVDRRYIVPDNFGRNSVLG